MHYMNAAECYSAIKRKEGGSFVGQCGGAGVLMLTEESNFQKDKNKYVY